MARMQSEIICANMCVFYRMFYAYSIIFYHVACVIFYTYYSKCKCHNLLVSRFCPNNVELSWQTQSGYGMCFTLSMYITQNDGVCAVQLYESEMDRSNDMQNEKNDFTFKNSLKNCHFSTKMSVNFILFYNMSIK